MGLIAHVSILFNSMDAILSLIKAPLFGYDQIFLSLIQFAFLLLDSKINAIEILLALAAVLKLNALNRNMHRLKKK